MSAKIIGFDQNHQRISTQQLLQQIYAELENGQTEFEILSSGHHDIGGPLWTQDGAPLKFRVKNPGQRVGSFALDGTEIVVVGSAPADAGWLCAGGEVTILGDGGDTTAHCAASRKIFVGGRVGTRSGFADEARPGLRASAVLGAQEHRLLLLRIHGRRHRRG